MKTGETVKAGKLSPVVNRLDFVETKTPYLPVVAALLEECAAQNQWANFGPLYGRLADEYATHMSLGPGLALTPCANAGIGLEMLARTLAADAGRSRLRWVGSAFSFKNLGRGYFSDMTFVDCDAAGRLDLEAVQALPADSWDGMVVTNPFGMVRQFNPYIRFARETGKVLIIDNAAGMARRIPDWPWQVFSLHHTKPYGFGEGGLVLSPETAREFLRLLINYDRVPGAPEYWLNNGKISDVACAFLIARLRRIADWEPGYLESRARIAERFVSMGARCLLPPEAAPPTTSLPVLLPRPVDEAALNLAPRRVAIARQYQPLAPEPTASEIFSHLINYPTHPDLASLSDADLTADMEVFFDA